MKLANKVALITGAGSGMGRAGALLFALEGAKVAVVDIDQRAAAQTAREIETAGGKAIALGADVSKKEDAQAMVAATVDKLGVPDIVYNNAGIEGESAFMAQLSEDAFDRVIAVNLRGVWLGMKHAIPYMIKAGGGSIVNTASIAALVPCNSAEYAASKAGVLALTKVAAQEYGPFNIRVNAICPGATATPMARRFAAANPGGSAASDPRRLERMSVLGRFGTPEEQAKAALFLASDDSSYATGSTFVIDGGWTSISLEGSARYTPEP
jgi:NAD(P)-dependent dehydrogenase (short-subunit alcohol dehydrogenase family)